MENNFRLGEWLVNPEAREISKEGVCERMDHKAMAVLSALADRQGEVVTRRELMDEIWPETHVTEDVLNVAISTLRKAFQDQAKNPTYIKTVPRIGYQLIAPVTQGPKAQRKAEIESRPRKSHWSWSLALVGVALLAWLALPSRHQTAPIHVMAVLPLANYSGQDEQDYLADGMTEALITRLARNPSPKIISRTSVMGYKDTKKNLVAIAEELGVEVILEGSIQKVGSRVRVNVQLIDARSDEHLWADYYDRDIDDLFTLQEHISDAVARQVNARLGGREEAVKVAPAAYDAYLRGRYYRNQPGRPDYQKAIAHFQDALQQSPAFAPAHAALAESYYMMAEIGARPSREMFTLGKAAAERAIANDPNLAQAHLARAIGLFGLDWDFDAAEAAFKKAIALDQSDTQSRRWYVRLLSTSSRFDEAIEQIKRIQELDPIAYSKVTLVNVLASARRFDQALAELLRLEAIMPNSPQLWSTYASLYEQMGETEKAFAAFVKYLRLTKTPDPQIAALAQAFKNEGPIGVYRILYAGALQPVRGYRSPVLLADQYIQLGQPEAAIDLLERGYRERDMQILWIGSNYRFAPLHDDQRFLDLVDKLGIPLQLNSGARRLVVN